jgi:UbiD family decarboxylase
MFQKDITSMRGTIEFLKEQNMVLEVKGEVDPIYEIAGIQKAFENGPVLLFKHIKGYPNVLNVANVFSRTEIAAKIFDVADPKKLKFKGVDAIRHPIPPKIVEEAPCQEVI